MYRNPAEDLAGLLDEFNSQIYFYLSIAEKLVCPKIILYADDEDQKFEFEDARRRLSKELKIESAKDMDILTAIQEHMVRRRRQADFAMSVIRKQEDYLKTTTVNKIQKNKQQLIYMEACLVNMFNVSHHWKPEIRHRWRDENFIDRSQESNRSLMHRYMTPTANDWRILAWYFSHEKKPAGIIETTKPKGPPLRWPYLVIDATDELFKPWFRKFGALAAQEAEYARWLVPPNLPPHAVIWGGRLAINVYREMPNAIKGAKEEFDAIVAADERYPYPKF